MKVKMEEDEDDEDDAGPEEVKEDSKKSKKESKNMNEYSGELFVKLPMSSLGDGEPLTLNVQLEGAGQTETILKSIVPSQLEMIRKTVDFINL